MAHPGGAFKVNSTFPAGAVKQLPLQTTPEPPADNSNDQKSCKKFSQIEVDA
jgi:hypothetical protein